ncbi:hypothetical protein Q8A67_011350 [Cirrhinus molitorella]|uniref:Uncharacterized protein n=1 Tax=Cirrhinus molitorella TaxID=172907 RepID=A0AA88Q297_9TELE|nr:hypothetical protein Q8A67_011350 [Cirrhinus molitorella]
MDSGDLCVSVCLSVCPLSILLACTSPHPVHISMENMKYSTTVLHSPSVRVRRKLALQPLPSAQHQQCTTTDDEPEPTLIGEPELEPEPEITLKPEPTKSMCVSWQDLLCQWGRVRGDVMKPHPSVQQHASFPGTTLLESVFSLSSEFPASPLVPPSPATLSQVCLQWFPSAPQFFFSVLH